MQPSVVAHDDERFQLRVRYDRHSKHPLETKVRAGQPTCKRALVVVVKEGREGRRGGRRREGGERDKGEEREEVGNSSWPNLGFSNVRKLSF